MNNTHIKAVEVTIGDNVWEHGIVENWLKIEDDKGNIVMHFNAGDVNEWVSDWDEVVMVTNR